jgi:hypothetical protein
MAIVLASKPGLSSTTTLHIPKDWDPTWFRNFISNQLKGADVRNAIGLNGISITGNISSPYATISIGANGPVTIPNNVTIDGAGTASAALIINANSGQTALQANGGPIYSAQLSGSSYLLNASGTDFGSIFVDGTQTWALGYAATETGSPTPVLTWSTSGIVTFPAQGGSVQSGTFTGTLTGMTGTTTGTFHYTIAGNVCTVSLANSSNVTGTSNSTSMTMTGLPAVCQPATQQPIVTCFLEDNGTGALATALIQQSGTIQFFKAVVSGTVVGFSSTGFTASGSKGMDSTVLTYSLQ